MIEVQGFMGHMGTWLRYEPTCLWSELTDGILPGIVSRTSVEMQNSAADAVLNESSLVSPLFLLSESTDSTSDLYSLGHL